MTVFISPFLTAITMIIIMRIMVITMIITMRVMVIAMIIIMRVMVIFQTKYLFINCTLLPMFYSVSWYFAISENTIYHPRIYRDV